MVRLALTLFLLFLAACSPQADQRLKPAGQGGGSGKDSNASEYDSYLIYFSNFSGVNEASETIEATVSPFIHTGLDPAKTYYYRVGGVKKGKYGPLSRELSAQPFIPGQATSNVGRPKLVNTTRSSATAINVSWASVPGAESYLVFYSMSPGVSRTSSSLTTASESVLHSNLLTGVIYYYRVAAVKGGLPGELSFEVSGVATSEVIDSGGAPPPQPPPAPMDFMVTTGINRSLQLDWTSVSGAEAYNIYFDTFFLCPVVETSVTSVLSCFSFFPLRKISAQSAKRVISFLIKRRFSNDLLIPINSVCNKLMYSRMLLPSSSSSNVQTPRYISFCD
ncbi:MAG: fibronectin type III domain-containing protein, partial [Chitinophagia bacterium]|nr:fibronectin type III domain-containing protein [Chitinophagia bacterium]